MLTKVSYSPFEIKMSSKGRLGAILIKRKYILKGYKYNTIVTDTFYAVKQTGLGLALLTPSSVTHRQDYVIDDEYIFANALGSHYFSGHTHSLVPVLECSRRFHYSENAIQTLHYLFYCIRQFS